jgi:hypothetical protein
MTKNKTEKIDEESFFLEEDDLSEKIEEKQEFDEEDIYCEEAADLMVEDDEVSAAEAAFMQGYEE